jgi:VanZ family protein
MNDPLDRSRRTTASAHGCAIVLLLATIFIVYDSLYPFQYYDRNYPGGPPAYLMSTWQGWDNNRNLLPNILLYLPFGFFATCALPRRLPGAVRAFIATLAGVALAGGIEMAQIHDLGRVSSMGDVYANGIGAGIRAVTGRWSLRWPLVGELAANPSAALLLTMFFGYRLFPYVPMIDLHKYWHAVQGMLTAPNLPLGQFSRYLVTWLFIAAMVHVLYGPRRFLLLFRCCAAPSLSARY